MRTEPEVTKQFIKRHHLGINPHVHSSHLFLQKQVFPYHPTQLHAGIKRPFLLHRHIQHLLGSLPRVTGDAVITLEKAK